MARDHSRINIAIWQDPDWRKLPPLAQHLYFVLWTHPDLSYAGVVDWRPGRLTPLAGGWTRQDVIAAADCLESRLFIVRDEETEECLIRSWVRWDGLLKQPIMSVSFANAFASVASNDIRGVIVHETIKLHKKEPELAGWRKEQVQHMLTLPAMDPHARHLPTDPLTPATTPTVTPGVTLSAGVGGNPSTNTPSTPAPAPATNTPNNTAPRKRGARIPDDFSVNDDMRSWAEGKGFGHLDLEELTEEFFDYWSGVAGSKAVKLDWVGTWRNRVREVAKRVSAPGPSSSPTRLPTVAEVRRMEAEREARERGESA